MKRIVFLLLLVFIIFLVWNRERIFVRDPFGSLTRNGVKEAGAQVYINYSNDVLVENDRAPMYVTLVQQGSPIGVPAKMTCIHWLACMTDANHATLVAAEPGTEIQSMSNKRVEFRDGEDRNAVVKLR